MSDRIRGGGGGGGGWGGPCWSCKKYATENTKRVREAAVKKPIQKERIERLVTLGREGKERDNDQRDPVSPQRESSYRSQEKPWGGGGRGGQGVPPGGAGGWGGKVSYSRRKKVEEQQESAVNCNKL